MHIEVLEVTVLEKQYSRNHIITDNEYVFKEVGADTNDILNISELIEGFKHLKVLMLTLLVKVDVKIDQKLTLDIFEFLMQDVKDAKIRIIRPFIMIITIKRRCTILFNSLHRVHWVHWAQIPR